MDRRWQILWRLGEGLAERYRMQPLDAALWLFRGFLLRWLEDQRVQGTNQKHRLLDYETFQYPLIIPLVAREMESLHPSLSGLFPPQYDWGPLISVIDGIRTEDFSDLTPLNVQTFLREGLEEFPWEYPLTDAILAFLFDTLQIGPDHQVYIPNAGSSPVLFPLWRRTQGVRAWESSPVGPLLKTLWFFMDRSAQVFAQGAPEREGADFLLACGQTRLEPLGEYAHFLKKGGRLVWISQAPPHALQAWLKEQGGQAVCLKDPGDPITIFFWQKPNFDGHDPLWAQHPFPDGEGDPYPESWKALSMRIEEVFLLETPAPGEPPLEKGPEKKPEPTIRSWLETLPDLSADGWLDFASQPQTQETAGDKPNLEEQKSPAESSPLAASSPVTSPKAPEEFKPANPKAAEEFKPLTPPFAPRQIHNLYKAASHQTLRKK